MAETRAVNPLVEQFKAGAVPKDLRLMAAQGALPLKPVDLLELVLHLAADRDPEVVEASNATLASLPASDLLPVFKDRETPAHLLAWGAKGRSEKDLREALIQNHTTPDEALEAIAPTLTQELSELIVINQTRLLRSTRLLEALESNAGLSNDQKRRLRELRETFRVGAEPEAPPPPPEPEPEPEADAASPEEPAPLTESEAIARYLTADELQEEEKVKAVTAIYQLNSAQKVILALKGSREERAILIRDPNRIVSAAVLGSPRVTDPEIESFAGMKNVSDAVLRRIGRQRDWMRRYAVVINLVKNPRTPLSISVGLIPRLNPRDMKVLSTDRNVPEVIRKTALKFVRSPNK
jgi:hypothetical protein